MLSDEEPVTLYYDATTEKVPALIGFIPAHHAKKYGKVINSFLFFWFCLMCCFNLKVGVDELNDAITKQLVREFGPEAGKVDKILTR